MKREKKYHKTKQIDTDTKNFAAYFPHRLCDLVISEALFAYKDIWDYSATNLLYPFLHEDMKWRQNNISGILICKYKKL